MMTVTKSFVENVRYSIVIVVIEPTFAFCVLDMRVRSTDMEKGTVPCVLNAPIVVVMVTETVTITTATSWNGTPNTVCVVIVEKKKLKAQSLYSNVNTPRNPKITAYAPCVRTGKCVVGVKNEGV